MRLQLEEEVAHISAWQLAQVRHELHKIDPVPNGAAHWMLHKS